MPILEVEMVGAPEGEDLQAMTRALADAAGVALGSRPAGTWVRMRFLSPACYAENQVEQAPRPVFVSVIKRTVQAPEELAPEAEALTAAIAGVCGRPADQVHLVYQPAAAGRVSFGGTLVPVD